jgi:hypothetical protein
MIFAINYISTPSHERNHSKIQIKQRFLAINRKSLNITTHSWSLNYNISNGRSVAKTMSVAKDFSDGTYNDHPYGSLKVFSNQP